MLPSLFHLLMLSLKYVLWKDPYLLKLFTSNYYLYSALFVLGASSLKHRFCPSVLVIRSFQLLTLGRGMSAIYSDILRASLVLLISSCPSLAVKLLLRGLLSEFRSKEHFIMLDLVQSLEEHQPSPLSLLYIWLPFSHKSNSLWCLLSNSLFGRYSIIEIPRCAIKGVPYI